MDRNYSSLTYTVQTSKGPVTYQGKKLEISSSSLKNDIMGERELLKLIGTSFSESAELDKNVISIRSEHAFSDVNLDHIERSLASHPITYSIVFEPTSTQHKDDVVSFSMKGQSSFLVQTSDSYSQDDLYKHVTVGSSSIKEIAQNIYLIQYHSESLACEDYKVFAALQNQLDDILHLEPNFTHNHLIPAKDQDDYKNLKRYSEITATNQEDTISQLEDDNFLKNLRQSSELNAIQYKNIGLTPYYNTLYGDSKIVIGIADSYVELNHNCFSSLEISKKSEDFTDNEHLNPAWDKKRPHGTAVAGLAMGYEKNVFGSKHFRGTGAGCSLRSAEIIKMYSDGGYSTSTAAIIRGLHWLAYDQKVDIISCSWFIRNESPIIVNFIIAILKGTYNTKRIPIVFAAGNNLKDSVRPPANTQGVICVGATHLDNNFIEPRPDYWYSCSGKDVTISSPGCLLISADLTGKNEGRNYAIDGLTSFNHALFWGTSAAAPIVTGIIALLKSKYPNIDIFKIIDILHKNPHVPKYWDKNNWGVGIINLELAIKELEKL